MHVHVGSGGRIEVVKRRGMEHSSSSFVCQSEHIVVSAWEFLSLGASVCVLVLGCEMKTKHRTTVRFPAPKRSKFSATVNILLKGLWT